VRLFLFLQRIDLRLRHWTLVLRDIIYNSQIRICCYILYNNKQQLINIIIKIIVVSIILMKAYGFIKIIFGVIGIININAFVNINRISNSVHNKLITKSITVLKYENEDHFTPENNNNKNNNNPVKKKLDGIIRLVRPKSILPTTFLCIAGGWIMNPSFYNLITSIKFNVSSICTILILMSSMVINDVYDVETDKINNPLRPIPSGQIKIYEAIILNLLLLGTAEYLSIRFLSTNPQLLVDFVIVVVGIYTSILKRIPLIKNVSCAGIVALSIFFAGLASNTETALITENKNFGLLAIAVDLIFYGSLSNEILLDIRDYDGDKANKIYTLPVIFGKDIALISANIITNLNIMSNGLALMYLTNFYYGGLLILLCFPLSFNLFQLRNKNNKNNSNEQIIKVVNDTTIPLFFILLYMCVLASINHF